jgi:histidinol-phosphate aminotransferase
MNTLSAVAAVTSLRDTGHIADEVAENSRIRRMVVSAFRDLGYDLAEPHANFVFVNLGRPASSFRDECRAKGLAIGRDFPPLEQTHSRVSLGTMEEMERSVTVFREILRA